MKPKHIALIIGLAAAIGVFYYLFGGSLVPKGQSPLVSLNPGNFSLLKDAFNASAHSTRVLVLLSPT